MPRHRKHHQTEKQRRASLANLRKARAALKRKGTHHRRRDRKGRFI